MKTTKQLLVSAREKLTEGWTQGYVARNRAGTEVSATDARAVCFCAFGALVASTDADEDPIMPAVRLLVKQMGQPVASYNDSHSREEVLASYDRAIAECPE